MMTVGIMNADPDEQIRYRARTQDAKIDLELAEMELEQHQRRHALAAETG